MSSLRPRSFSDLFNFSRSTVGTYCGADGVLASAAVNVARIGYDPVTLACRGLLIEPARTNYLLRSQEFDNASWSKARASVTANADVAPDGTMTADKLVEDTTVNDSHYLAQTYTKTSSTEVQPYSASIWVKAAGRTQILIQAMGASGSWGYGIFNLSTGVVSSSLTSGQYSNLVARIEAWPRGWYRCTIDFLVNNDGHGTVAFVVELLNNGVPSYTGDGTSGVYLWGAQLEKGFYGSSYIPTTTAAAARERDVCTLQTLSPWFQESEGTLFVEYVVDWTQAAGDGGFPRMVQIDDGTEVDRHVLYLANGARGFTVTTGNVAQVSSSRGNHAPGVVQRQAMAWDTDDVAIAATGSAVATDTAAVIPTGLTTFRLGASSSSGSNFLGYLRKVRFYPRNMTDAELLALVA